MLFLDVSFAAIAVNKVSMGNDENVDQKLTVVAAAALIDAAGRVLMQRRPSCSQHGGLWEFPGGKREPGETLSECLARELTEELGISVDPAVFRPAGWSIVTHGQGELMLALMTCRRWTGEPTAQDGATLRWCNPQQIMLLPMPPADVPLAAGLPTFL
jgi:8-oxo-dGTP diphosphatase